MKEAIKLVLVYFACQIVGAILAMIPCAIIALVLYKDFSLVQDMMLAPSMLVGFALMTFYLFRKKYIPFDLQSWSAISASYLSSVILLTFSVMFLIDWLMSHLTFLPNWLDASFDVLSSNWLGILSVSVLGPILEELLFRGAITKILLKKYKPAKAIILSGLIFGIFHLNPVQVVGADGKQHVSGGKRLIEFGERLVGVLIAIDFPGFGHGLVQVLRGWLHRSFGLFDE